MKTSSTNDLLMGLGLLSKVSTAYMIAPPMTPRGLKRGRLTALLGILLLVLSLTSRTGKAELGSHADRKLLACLSWAPEPKECPTPRQIQTAVEDILGRRVFTEPPCDLVVRGEIRQPDDGAWTANLSFVKSSGEDLGSRTLKSRADSCAALRDPVSLVIALIVGENDAQTTLEVPLAEPSSPPPAERGGATSASFVLASGILPNLAYGAGIDWAADMVPWLAVQIGGSLFFPNATRQSGPGGEFWAWLGDVALCPRVFVRQRADGWLCIGGRVGAIHGAGIHMGGLGISAIEETRPYGDVETHLKLSFPILGSLAGFAQLGVAVPWLRPRFIYPDVVADTSVVVHQPQAAVLFAAVGFELLAGARSPSRTIAK